MASSGMPQVVVLCEDRAQYHFVRKYLRLRGITRIVQRTSPLGRGAGEQWVRRKYAEEIRAYRSKASYLGIALAVMIDADLHRVNDRKRQLNTSPEMAECVQDPRTERERIAIFVPKRSVETWFAFLQGDPWDEQRSQRLRYHNANPSKYAELLSDQCQNPESTPSMPPSLQDACEEWTRLDIL